MQEPLFSPSFDRKLYTERAILIGTFIGGPLAGGYLLAQNFSTLDKKADAGRTWLIVTVLMLLTMSTAFVPALDSIPAFVYSFVFCLAAHSAARKLQGSQIHFHQENGGSMHNTWKAVLVGVVFFLLMMAFILGIVYLQDPGLFK